MRHHLRRIAVAAALAAFAACDSSPSGGTPAPSPTPSAAPTARPPTPPPDVILAPLTVSCTARPRTGDVPLRVDFTASAAGGRLVYEYAWDFGDGSEGSGNPAPSHIYETPGDYEATVTVTDRAQATASCSRSIAATRSATPAPAMRQLEVAVSGPTPFSVGSPGTPLACANPPGPANVCTISLADGAQISVGAFRSIPAPGPPPVSWTGDCVTTFPTNTSWVCRVEMNGDRRIVATSN